VATLRCSDCGKPDVHLTDFFLVPDKVWDALCLLDAILCLGCFGKRLNPADPRLSPKFFHDVLPIQAGGWLPT
jgi:hypothetical protein